MSGCNEDRRGVQTEPKGVVGRGGGGDCREQTRKVPHTLGRLPQTCHSAAAELPLTTARLPQTNARLPQRAAGVPQQSANLPQTSAADCRSNVFAAVCLPQTAADRRSMNLYFTCPRSTAVHCRSVRQLQCCGKIPLPSSLVVSLKFKLNFHAAIGTEKCFLPTDSMNGWGSRSRLLAEITLIAGLKGGIGGVQSTMCTTFVPTAPGGCPFCWTSRPMRGEYCGLYNASGRGLSDISAQTESVEIVWRKVPHLFYSLPHIPELEAEVGIAPFAANGIRTGTFNSHQRFRQIGPHSDEIVFFADILGVSTYLGRMSERKICEQRAAKSRDQSIIGRGEEARGLVGDHLPAIVKSTHHPTQSSIAEGRERTGDAWYSRLPRPRGAGTGSRRREGGACRAWREHTTNDGEPKEDLEKGKEGKMEKETSQAGVIGPMSRRASGMGICRDHDGGMG
ncbi:hypothetical protein FB451DRAFT_1180720 [Mycena latifolia]|nr:hypothetical protein FB451DRAFT_1180720 [Mycena latifolia]